MVDAEEEYNLFACLQREFAQKFGVDHPIFVGSGSEAFLVALLATGVAAHSEILIPVNICPTIVTSIMLAGAVPVLVDVDYDLCISEQSLCDHMGTETKGILAVHPHGRVAILGSIACVCEEQGITLFEDCAACLVEPSPAGWPGRTGDFAIYSFGFGKHLSAGGGGAIGAKDPYIAQEIIESLSRVRSSWPRRF